MRIGLFLAGLALLMTGASVARAAEISLVSGFYQSEETKVDSNSAGTKQSISFGGRFSNQIEGHTFWFAEGGLAMRSYSKGDQPKAPSDTSGLSLGGGVRYYFQKLAEAISPYAEGSAHYRDDKDATQSTGGFTETETSGLFYGAAFGIRFNLQKEFFVDIGTTLFDSPLFATEKSDETHFGAAGATTQTKNEKKRTELFVNSTGAFATATVAVGMRL